jgi:Transposase DDE domain
MFETRRSIATRKRTAELGVWRVVRFIIGKSEFILFTNCWDLSTWQIIIIYAYRWQIELCFLFVKRTMSNGLHLLTHSKNGLEIQFYLMLISALLLLHFKQRNEAATAENIPEGEPVQVPCGSLNAPERHESNSQPTASQEGSEGQRSVPEEEVPKIAPETREEQGASTEQQQPSTPSRGDQAEPARGKAGAAKQQGEPVGSKAHAEKPTRQGTIENKDNAKWYNDLGKKLRTFWRISIHWLQTLRDNLARVWHPAIFSRLAGYAKQSK